MYAKYILKYYNWLINQFKRMLMFERVCTCMYVLVILHISVYLVRSSFNFFFNAASLRIALVYLYFSHAIFFTHLIWRLSLIRWRFFCCCFRFGGWRFFVVVVNIQRRTEKKQSSNLNKLTASYHNNNNYILHWWRWWCCWFNFITHWIVCLQWRHVQCNIWAAWFFVDNSESESGLDLEFVAFFAEFRWPRFRGCRFCTFRFGFRCCCCSDYFQSTSKKIQQNQLRFNF